eukprot:56373-Eustigmatos_ZCMA.PRE.1
MTVNYAYVIARVAQSLDRCPINIFKVLFSGAAPVVAKTFTLDEAPIAHKQVISHSDGAAGNLVIVPGAS